MDLNIQQIMNIAFYATLIGTLGAVMGLGIYKILKSKKDKIARKEKVRNSHVSLERQIIGGLLDYKEGVGIIIDSCPVSTLPLGTSLKLKGMHVEILGPGDQPPVNRLGMYIKGNIIYSVDVEDGSEVTISPEPLNSAVLKLPLNLQFWNKHTLIIGCNEGSSLNIDLSRMIDIDGSVLTYSGSKDVPAMLYRITQGTTPVMSTDANVDITIDDTAVYVSYNIIGHNDGVWKVTRKYWTV